MVILGTAVFCLAYYLTISLKMKKWNSTFAGFWPGAGAGCILLYLAYAYGSDRIKLAAVGSFSIALFVFAAVEIRILAGMREEKNTDCPYIIVLGAQIRGTAVTDSLRRRLDRGAGYLFLHPDTRVIVSGGQGKGEDVTEAQAMEDYLIRAGISPSRIIKEDRSVSTRENLAFSKKLIPDLRQPAGIVTNQFHMFRAKCWARREGFLRPAALPAGCSRILLLNYLTREFFAVWKMWIFR